MSSNLCLLSVVVNCLGIKLAPTQSTWQIHKHGPTYLQCPSLLRWYSMPGSTSKRIMVCWWVTQSWPISNLTKIQNLSAKHLQICLKLELSQRQMKKRNSWRLISKVVSSSLRLISIQWPLRVMMLQQQRSKQQQCQTIFMASSRLVTMNTQLMDNLTLLV